MTVARVCVEEVPSGVPYDRAGLDVDRHGDEEVVADGPAARVRRWTGRAGEIELQIAPESARGSYSPSFFERPPGRTPFPGCAASGGTGRDSLVIRFREPPPERVSGALPR